ncbi:hypothetical protein ACTTDI_22455, partial [Escherichia coli]
QKLAEYLVLYNSKRPHKALALMTPVEYILKENKNCNMWWTHTNACNIDFVMLLSCARPFSSVVRASDS